MYNKIQQKIIAVKFPTETALLIQKISKERGECISTFIRRTIKKELAKMSYLSNSEKKALEVKQKENRRI